MINVNNMFSNVTTSLQTCYTIYKYYQDILNSYVSDYYVDNHWNKLPKNWQEDLKDISTNQIGELLDFTKPVNSKVYSLTLLCLRNLVISNSIPRKKIDILNANLGANVKYIFEDKNVIKFFWKNVKLKKRHEINIMAQMCYKTAVQSNCFYIVDIGSGLGHLSRMLSYGYGFKVCTFEVDATLCHLAEKLDKKLEDSLKSKYLLYKETFKTIHVNKRIEPYLQTEDFLKLVQEVFKENDRNFKFGIVGLHPCGNLGSTLLRIYSECPNVVFINIASCCYMKLTLQPSLNPGFPLSSYCKSRNFNLTYLSCEIACHAIENYVKKLREQHFYKLKIHAYRAALEKVLVSIDKNFQHSAVCSVKYDESLSFKIYCEKVLSKFGIEASNETISFYEELINKTWKNVTIFYSVRLFLAPLVETIILLDRLLYVEECKSCCDILPAFDCNISPRNHVLSAIKKI